MDSELSRPNQTIPDLLTWSTDLPNLPTWPTYLTYPPDLPIITFKIRTYNLQTRVTWPTWPTWPTCRYLELGQLRKFFDVFSFCVLSHCHLGENVWQNIFLVLRSECLWMKTRLVLKPCAKHSNVLYPMKWILNIAFGILNSYSYKGNLLHEPLRQFLLQRSPWGAHLIKWSQWYKTLLWWDCCGQVAIQHCVICIQLKIQSNSFYKLYSKSKNVFRPVKILLLSFLIGR